MPCFETLTKGMPTLVYHLSSLKPVVKGVSSNPSINQPTSGKRTSMTPSFSPKDATIVGAGPCARSLQHSAIRLWITGWVPGRCCKKKNQGEEKETPCSDFSERDIMGYQWDIPHFSAFFQPSLCGQGRTSNFGSQLGNQTSELTTVGL
jgi:hypothetical protein